MPEGKGRRLQMWSRQRSHQSSYQGLTSATGSGSVTELSQSGWPGWSNCAATAKLWTPSWTPPLRPGAAHPKDHTVQAHRSRLALIVAGTGAWLSQPGPRGRRPLRHVVCCAAAGSAGGPGTVRGPSHVLTRACQGISQAAEGQRRARARVGAACGVPRPVAATTGSVHPTVHVAALCRGVSNRQVQHAALGMPVVKVSRCRCRAWRDLTHSPPSGPPHSEGSCFARQQRPASSCAGEVAPQHRRHRVARTLVLPWILPAHIPCPAPAATLMRQRLVAACC